LELLNTTNNNLLRVLKENKCLGVIGSRHCGKTTTLLNLVETVKESKYNIYYYAYHEETKSLIQSKYKNVVFFNTIEELEQIEQGFIFIDEFHTLINLQDRHQKQAIERLFNQLYQKQGVCMVLCSTPEYYNKVICSGIDNFIINRITDFKQLVQGSKIAIYIKYIGSNLKGMNCFNVPIGKSFYKGSLINIKYDNKTDKKANQIDLFEGL